MYMTAPFKFQKSGQRASCWYDLAMHDKLRPEYVTYVAFTCTAYLYVLSRDVCRMTYGVSVKGWNAIDYASLVLNGAIIAHIPYIIAHVGTFRT